MQDQHRFKIIENKLNSEDYLQRCDVVSDLAKYIDDFRVANILMEMLEDKNYLVRCEVCDALYGFKSEIVLNKLLTRIKKERSSTVRMYIISTIGSIIDCANNKNTIYEQLYILSTKETSKRVIIAYMSLFYLLNKDMEYINKALFYINDIDYHIRCNVINLLNEIVDNKNISIIINTYEKRLLIEDIFCVKDLLKTSLKELAIIHSKTVSSFV